MRFLFTFSDIFLLSYISVLFVIELTLILCGASLTHMLNPILVTCRESLFFLVSSTCRIGENAAFRNQSITLKERVTRGNSFWNIEWRMGCRAEWWSIYLLMCYRFWRPLRPYLDRTGSPDHPSSIFCHIFRPPSMFRASLSLSLSFPPHRSRAPALSSTLTRSLSPSISFRFSTQLWAPPRVSIAIGKWNP